MATGQPIAQLDAYGLQGRIVGVVTVDVGEEADIVAGTDAAEMRRQPGFDGRRLGGGAQGGGVDGVGVQRQSVGGDQRRRGFQLAGRLIGIGEGPGLDLAGFDIGLIERIDADHHAGDRSDLPAQKLLEQSLRVRRE